MTLDPFSTTTSSLKPVTEPASVSRHFAFGSTAPAPARSDVLEVSLTEQELLAIYRVTLPRVVTILAPVVFGLGLTSMIIALAFQPAGLLRPLLWGVLMIAAGVGLFRAPRQMTTQSMNRLGVDGTVSYRLWSTPEFLAIEDRTGQRTIRWNEIDAAQSTKGHLTLLRARTALFVPIRTDAENQHFAGLLTAQVSGGGVELRRQSVRGSLMFTAFYVFLAIVFGAVALFLAGRLDASRSTSNSDKIVCPQGEALQNNQPGARPLTTNGNCTGG